MATFVLVHGSFGGGWCWKLVTPMLRNLGHDVYAPTLTGLGERAHLLSCGVDLDTHIEDVTSLLFHEDLSGACWSATSYAGDGHHRSTRRGVPERISRNWFTLMPTCRWTGKPKLTSGPRRLPPARLSLARPDPMRCALPRPRLPSASLNRACPGGWRRGSSRTRWARICRPPRSAPPRAGPFRGRTWSARLLRCLISWRLLPPGRDRRGGRCGK